MGWWLTACVLAFAVGGGLARPILDLTKSPGTISVLPSLQVDAPTYDGIAQSLAATGVFGSIPVRQPPGFVYLLALLYSAFGHSWVHAKILLWIALAGATVASAWLAYRVWGATAGVAAALLTAWSPALRYYAGTIQYELIAAAGLLALLALAIRAVEASRPMSSLLWLLAAAALGGLLALTREVFIGLIPIAGLWIAMRLSSRVGVKTAGLRLTLFLAIAFAPVILWSIAQSQAHGAIVVISDKASVTFALGNNPLASGTYSTGLVGEPSGVSYLIEMPAAASRLALRKVLYFWGIRRDGWNVPRPAAWWLYRGSRGLIPLEAALPLARGGWLLVGFVLGTIMLWRRGLLAEWWVLPAIVLAVLFAHVATLSSHRFAVPILPIVFIIVCGPVGWSLQLVGKWVLQSWRRIAGAGVIAAVLVALQWAPSRGEVRYRATELDMFDEIDRHDPLAGRTVRFVDVARGRRAAMILGDEHMPAGELRWTISARRGDGSARPDTPVAHVRLLTLDGIVACEEDVPYGILFLDRFTDVWIPCRLPSEGPATLFVETLGVVDLAFDQVTLSWR